MYHSLLIFQFLPFQLIHVVFCYVTCVPLLLFFVLLLSLHSPERHHQSCPLILTCWILTCWSSYYCAPAAQHARTRLPAPVAALWGWGMAGEVGAASWWPLIHIAIVFLHLTHFLFHLQSNFHFVDFLFEYCFFSVHFLLVVVVALLLFVF